MTVVLTIKKEIMRIYSYILLIALCTIQITGCKKFIDVNNDPNNPLTVQESLILSPVELNISSVIAGGAGDNIIVSGRLSIEAT